MIDVEREIRAALARHASEVPTFDVADGPTIVRRTRTRQVVNGLGTLVVAALIAVGVTAGVSSLLRAEPHTPAGEVTPSPQISGALTPPAAAPVVVGSGSAEGWAWLLSASPDGGCVALTDAQGSELSCEPGRSSIEEQVVVGADAPRDDIVTSAVRSPRPPAPPMTLIFGRVPAEAASVETWTPLFEPTDGELLSAPDGVDLDVRYYVRWLSGYRFPYVPKVRVEALGEAGQHVTDSPSGLNGVVPTRPSWAQEPTFTTLHSIATGHSEVGTEGRDWEIGVFRNEATGLVCFGEVAGVSVCGPEDDPVPAWEDGIARYCARFEHCAWPPLIVIEGESGGNPEGVSSFGWGVFREPVVSVRAQRGPDGFYNPIPRDGWLESEIYDLPSEYGTPFRIFVWQCDDCLSGSTLGFDADGNEVARE